MTHDVFICHATEDKDDFVAELAEGLRENGLAVWYDDFTLKMGDNLSSSINRGLADSTFGIVVLSAGFFAKQWPQRELGALIAREDDGDKVILPIWHNVSKEDVLRQSPLLVDKVAARSEDGIWSVIQKILEVVRSSSRLRDPSSLRVDEMTIRRGKVVSFNEAKGFGFISGEDKREYFIHVSGIEDGTSFYGGDEVVFLAEKGDRGVKAVAARKV